MTGVLILSGFAITADMGIYTVLKYLINCDLTFYDASTKTNIK